jgi:hypothetical protein
MKKVGIRMGLCGTSFHSAEFTEDESVVTCKRCLQSIGRVTYDEKQRSTRLERKIKELKNTGLDGRKLA